MNFQRCFPTTQRSEPGAEINNNQGPAYTHTHTHTHTRTYVCECLQIELVELEAPGRTGLPGLDALIRGSVTVTWMQRLRLRPDMSTKCSLAVPVATRFRTP